MKTVITLTSPRVIARIKKILADKDFISKKVQRAKFQRSNPKFALVIPYDLTDYQYQPGFASTEFSTDSGKKYYVYFKDISSDGIKIQKFCLSTHRQRYE